MPSSTTSVAVASVMLTGGLAAGEAPAQTPIAQIQRVGHISPLVGQEVTGTGVVTARAFNGFSSVDPPEGTSSATVFLYDASQIKPMDFASPNEAVLAGFGETEREAQALAFHEVARALPWPGRRGSRWPM